MDRGEPRIFHSLTDRSEIDLVPHLQECVAGRDDVRIYVGTDSQNKDGKTVFASVVVVHYGNSGAHVVYTKRSVPRMRDMNARLWAEVQDSVDVANMLVDRGFMRPSFVDVDLNKDPRFGSNSLLRAALGFVEGSGFRARCKPDALSASYAADNIVNK